MSITTVTDYPCIGICVTPRATIRSVVDRNPRRWIVPIAVVAGLVAGIANVFGAFSLHHTDFEMRMISVTFSRMPGPMRLATAILWPLASVAFLYIDGSLTRWTGGLLGGTADTAEARAAAGWARVPLALFILACLVVELVMPRTSWVSYAILTPILIWALVIWFKSVAEVHRFSVWRGAAAWLIEVLFLIGAVTIVETVVVLSVFPFLS